MSIVIAFVLGKHLYMASDGRAVDSQNNIREENFKKIKRYGDNCIIGYAGCNFVADKTFEYLDKVYMNNELTDDEAFKFYFKLSLENAYKEFLHKYRQDEVTNFIIGFKSKILTISTIDLIFQEAYVESNQSFIAKLLPPNLTEDEFNLIASEEIRKGVTPKKFLTRVIERVSELNVTVNNNVYTEELWGE